MVWRITGCPTTTHLGLPQATRRRHSRCSAGADSVSLVLPSCARNSTASGCAEPGERGADEYTRYCRGKLALAPNPAHALCEHLSITGGRDRNLEAVRHDSKSAVVKRQVRAMDPLGTE